MKSPLHPNVHWLYEAQPMPNISIRLRLIFLSVLLLAILAGSSALLIRELVRDFAKSCRRSQARLGGQERQFGQQALRRLEVLGGRFRGHAARSLSASGGRRQSRARLRSEGDFRGRSLRPSAAIGGEVYAMTDLTRQAGVAYSSDDSAAGNALLAQAKSRIMTIDDHLDKIVDRVRAAGPGPARCVDSSGGVRRQARDRGRNRRAGACAGLHRIDRPLDHDAAEATGPEHRLDHAWRARTSPCRPQAFPRSRQ